MAMASKLRSSLMEEEVEVVVDGGAAHGGTEAAKS